VYKSLGFTSGRLRLQFAVRFFLIAVIGSAVGTVASLVFSQKLIIAMLRLIGVTSLKTSFSVLTFVLPISLICLCFFLFAFIASAKIKKVEVKELVTE
ncbi:MAG TPA: FtsX-like permease family protein, partial [Oscillospiraceae bacterium]|nr:FtsX-like permease family protein [Oscillospiraceae bacterium]